MSTPRAQIQGVLPARGSPRCPLDGQSDPWTYHEAVPPARFKDLCIDAVDASALGAFWSAALGLRLEELPSGETRLTGPTATHTIWVNQVPEPKTVKYRVHLDVHGSSIESLRTLGASVIDDESFSWVVMSDPEGGEFCLFGRETPTEYRLYELVIDCTDHAAISNWWASMIGGVPQVDDRGYSYIERVPGVPFEKMSFVPVGEPKSVKNRIHMDVFADGIEPLVEAGATLLRHRDDEIGWDVLADPEGNEFCVFSTS